MRKGGKKDDSITENDKNKRNVSYQDVGFI